jgi:hypothetical protein
LDVPISGGIIYRVVLRHLYINATILSRQARDKRRESITQSKETGVSALRWGYIASFFVNSIEVAQEAVGEVNNLLVLIPWAILTFATDEQNIPLENVLSVIPGAEEDPPIKSSTDVTATR